MNATPREALVGLFYTLLRDHIQPGVLEKLVRETEHHPPPYIFSNEHLAAYAKEIVNRLEEIPDIYSCEECYKGLDVFNESPIAGWVEIQRCDTCERYDSDISAALAVSRRARVWDIVAECLGIYLSEESEFPGDYRCVVPTADAIRFGLVIT